jgi:hypothetical protein
MEPRKKKFAMHLISTEKKLQSKDFSGWPGAFVKKISQNVAQHILGKINTCITFYRGIKVANNLASSEFL